MCPLPTRKCCRLFSRSLAGAIKTLKISRGTKTFLARCYCIIFLLIIQIIALGNVCILAWSDSIICVLQSVSGLRGSAPAVLLVGCDSDVLEAVPELCGAFSRSIKILGCRRGNGRPPTSFLLVASSQFKTFLMHYLTEFLGKNILMLSYSVLFYYLFIKNIAFVHFSL